MATPQELGAVAELYARVGYEGGLREEDQICVARVSGVVVAAVRLCDEFNALVLRGMFVDEAYRGRGLGRDLLALVGNEIGARECWCVPYDHLVPFYSRIGFRVVDRVDWPAFLAERVARYGASGSAVVVMRRRLPG